MCAILYFGEVVKQYTWYYDIIVFGVFDVGFYYITYILYNFVFWFGFSTFP
jgi:hypothetical protein